MSPAAQPPIISFSETGCLTTERGGNFRSNSGMRAFDYQAQSLCQRHNPGKIEGGSVGWVRRRRGGGISSPPLASATPLLQRGLTPLHGAAEYGHAETCELLIKYGADVNAEDPVKAGEQLAYDGCKQLFRK